MLQNLEHRTPVVNPDGTPTDYFIRLLQGRGGLLEDAGDQIDLLNAAIAALLARQIIAGIGLDGGGTLAADITIDANASAILDTISATRGVLLYRGAAGWAALAPGTAGYLLKTNGAGADPSWVVSPAGGNGARGIYGPMLSKGNNSAVFTAGYVGAISVYLLPGETISYIGFEANAAAATTKWRVGLYADSAGAMGALLVQQTALTTGIAAELNVGTLATTYTNTSGSVQRVWLALTTDTANFNIRTGGGTWQTRNWNNAGSTFPDPASAQSAGTLGWLLFALA